MDGVRVRRKSFAIHRRPSTTALKGNKDRERETKHCYHSQHKTKRRGDACLFAFQYILVLVNQRWSAILESVLTRGPGRGIIWRGGRPTRALTPSYDKASTQVIFLVSRLKVILFTCPIHGREEGIPGNPNVLRAPPAIGNIEVSPTRITAMRAKVFMHIRHIFRQLVVGSTDSRFRRSASFIEHFNGNKIDFLSDTECLPANNSWRRRKEHSPVKIIQRH